MNRSIGLLVCASLWSLASPTLASHHYTDVYQGQVIQLTRQPKLRVRLKITRCLNFQRAHELGQEKVIKVTTSEPIEKGKRYFFGETHSGGVTSKGPVDHVSWTWYGQKPPGWVKRADEFDQQKISQSFDRQMAEILEKKAIDASAAPFLGLIYGKAASARGRVQRLGGQSDLDLVSPRQYEKIRAGLSKGSRCIYRSDRSSGQKDSWVLRFSQRIVIDNGKTGEHHRTLSDKTRYFLSQMDLQGEIKTIFEIHDYR